MDEMSISSIGGFILRGEGGNTRRKASPIVTLPTTNPTRPALRSAPVFADKMSVYIAFMRVPV
jgi:hypothetical protein